MKGGALALVAGTLLTVDQGDLHRTNMDHASAAVSADGAFVAFTTYAQLVAADADASSDVYVFDRAAHRITLESADAGNVRGDTSHPGISGDGRIVVFDHANTIVIRDRGLAVTTIVGSGNEPVVTEDGSRVLFSAASVDSATAPDANGPHTDVYSVDVKTGRTRLVSVAMQGLDPAFTASVHPTASRDGRYVAFASRSVVGGRRGLPRVFVRDTELNVTRLVADGWDPSLSSDGRYIAFTVASKLGPQISVADLQSGDTRIITTSVSGGPGNGVSGKAKMSGDGRVVAFQSEASDLVTSDDFNLLPDVFVFDRAGGTTTRVSGDAAEAWMEPSGGPSIDAHGSVIAFSSRHPTGASDKRNDFDLYVATLSTEKKRGGGPFGPPPVRALCSIDFRLLVLR